MEEKISNNRILINHAEWLKNYGLKKEADECLKQAKKYTDERQVNGRKKYEATKLHASSNGMGNAYRVPRPTRL
jgi:hypothetical protein